MRRCLGCNPGGYHFVNVLLHTMRCSPAFLRPAAMTGALWRSAFVAAIFAIHPLRAESVVWISERKDVLSGVFFFLCLWAYVRYARRPSSLGRYLLVAVALTLGLLAKAMLVTFPFLLLLLDYWPLRRFPLSATPGRRVEASRLAVSAGWSWKRFRCSCSAIAISIATILSQEQALGAAAELAAALAGRKRARHDLDLSAPDGLAAAPGRLLSASQGSAFALDRWLVAACVCSAVSLGASSSAARSIPIFSPAGFGISGCSSRSSGCVQVGWQAHADRYTYLPQIGIYLVIAWGAADLTANWPSRRVLLGGRAAAIIVAAHARGLATDRLLVGAGRLWAAYPRRDREQRRGRARAGHGLAQARSRRRSDRA